MQDAANNSHGVLSIPAVLVFVPLHGLLGILALFLNCLVILAIRNNVKLQTTSGYFIVSLATSDLVIGTVCIPLWMRHIVRGRLPKVPPDILYKIWLFSDVVGGAASIYSLSMISYERYLCISSPLEAYLLLTKKKSKTCLIAIWVLSLALGILQCVIGPDIPKPGKEIFYPLACFLLPLLFMARNYLRIFKMARHQMHKINTSVPSKVAQGVHIKELKATKTIGILIGVFSLSLAPFFVLNLVYGLCECFAGISKNVVLTVKWLHYLNCVLNPLIYTWRNLDFRIALSKLFETPRKNVKRMKYQRTHIGSDCSRINVKPSSKNWAQKESPQQESSV